MNKLFFPDYGAWSTPRKNYLTVNDLYAPTHGSLNDVSMVTLSKEAPHVLEKWLKEIRKEVIYNEGDWVIIDTGKTNSGKSNTTFFLADKIDETFLKQTPKLERVCFAMNDFTSWTENATENVTRGKAVAFDEGAAVALASEFNTKESRAFKKFFMFNREVWGLYTFINIPNLEYIDRYFRINRIDTLVECFSKYDKNIETPFGKGLNRRGFASFYSGKKAKQVRKDTSTGEWVKPSPSFTHTEIPNFKAISPEHKRFWENYKNKKRAFLLRAKEGEWDYTYLDKNLKPRLKKEFDAKARTLDD